MPPVREYQATIFTNCEGCKHILSVVRDGKTIETIDNDDIETQKVFKLQTGDQINASILSPKDQRMTLAIWSGSENVYQDEIDLIQNEWKRFNFVLP